MKINKTLYILEKERFLYLNFIWQKWYLDLIECNNCKVFKDIDLLCEDLKKDKEERIILVFGNISKIELPNFIYDNEEIIGICSCLFKSNVVNQIKILNKYRISKVFGDFYPDEIKIDAESKGEYYRYIKKHIDVINQLNVHDFSLKYNPDNILILHDINSNSNEKILCKSLIQQKSCRVLDLNSKNFLEEFKSFSFKTSISKILYLGNDQKITHFFTRILKCSKIKFIVYREHELNTRYIINNIKNNYLLPKINKNLHIRKQILSILDSVRYDKLKESHERKSEIKYFTNNEINFIIQNSNFFSSKSSKPDKFLKYSNINELSTSLHIETNNISTFILPYDKNNNDTAYYNLQSRSASNLLEDSIKNLKTDFNSYFATALILEKYPNAADDLIKESNKNDLIDQKYLTCLLFNLQFAISSYNINLNMIKSTQLIIDQNVKNIKILNERLLLHGSNLLSRGLFKDFDNLISNTNYELPIGFSSRALLLKFRQESPKIYTNNSCPQIIELEKFGRKWLSNEFYIGNTCLWSLLTEFLFTLYFDDEKNVLKFINNIPSEYPHNYITLAEMLHHAVLSKSDIIVFEISKLIQKSFNQNDQNFYFRFLVDVVNSYLNNSTSNFSYNPNEFNNQVSPLLNLSLLLQIEKQRKNNPVIKNLLFALNHPLNREYSLHKE